MELHFRAVVVVTVGTGQMEVDEIFASFLQQLRDEHPSWSLCLSWNMGVSVLGGQE